MKKLGLLMMVCVLLLGGCSKETEEQPEVTLNNYELYHEAMQQQQNAKGIEMHSKIVFPDLPLFTDLGGYVGEGMVVNAKINNPMDPENIEGYYDMKFGIGSIETYIKDKTVYADTFGMKIKGPYIPNQMELPDFDLAAKLMVDDEKIKDFKITTDQNLVIYTLDLKTPDEIEPYANFLWTALGTDFEAYVGVLTKTTSLKLEYSINKKSKTLKRVALAMDVEYVETKESDKAMVEVDVYTLSEVTIDYPSFADYKDQDDLSRDNNE